MTFEKVVKVLAEYKDLNPDNITKETTFADLELDSLDTVEIVMNLEEEFGITIEIEEGIKTVGDIVKLIEKAQ